MNKSYSKQFKELAELFLELEQTASSLKMIDILAQFFKDINPEDARIAAHLLRGEVAPPYEGLELGLAEKLIIRSIAQATGFSVEEVSRRFGQKGDLGIIAEELTKGKRGTGLRIEEVFDGLKQIALTSGQGSQEGKIKLLAELIGKCSSIEARYIVRLVLGTLRLGVAEMTFLNGLSKALTGSKADKKVLEEAYNVLSDLGEVAYQAVKNGVDAIKDAKPVVGAPVRMMLASRIEELDEVKEHIPKQVFVEYKYDGERIQTHIKRGGEIILFSRRHENITHQFPDVISELKRSFKGKETVVEGEAVPVNPKTGKLEPFQILMTRRRKHGIEEQIKKVPVRYFLFDLLHLDGKSLLKSPLAERKEALENSFSQSGEIAFAQYIKTETLGEIEAFFLKTLKQGAEGVMIKDAQSVYEAGHRGWNWIKFKKEYREELADTFDLAVIGGLYGTGRRGGTYGSLLVAAFDSKTNKYYSFTKVGTGFTDADLAGLKTRLDKYKIKEKHRLVETEMKADVWFEPQVVMEISGAEITVSPIHTVAREQIKRGGPPSGEARPAGGLALRFPVFLRWRDDKEPEQATSVEEIYQLYKNIKKK